MRRALSLILCLLIASVCLAQNASIPPRGKYRHKKTIAVKYDKFTDRTLVSLAYLKM